MYLKDKMYYKKNPELRRFVNDVCEELLGIISKKIDNGGLGEVCVAVSSGKNDVIATILYDVNVESGESN